MFFNYVLPFYIYCFNRKAGQKGEIKATMEMLFDEAKHTEKHPMVPLVNGNLL